MIFAAAAFITLLTIPYHLWRSTDHHPYHSNPGTGRHIIAASAAFTIWLTAICLHGNNNTLTWHTAGWATLAVAAWISWRLHIDVTRTNRTTWTTIATRNGQPTGQPRTHRAKPTPRRRPADIYPTPEPHTPPDNVATWLGLNRTHH